MAFSAAALAKLATGCFLMVERTFLEGLVPPFPIHFVTTEVENLSEVIARVEGYSNSLSGRVSFNRLLFAVQTGAETVATPL